jgi:lipopolysaccharide transport system permease protein
MEQPTEAPAGTLAQRPRWRRVVPVAAATSLRPFRAAAQPVIVIDAETPRTKVELRELWAGRELLRVFAWRDVKVRYKQSMIGFAWAIVQPLFTMIVFSYIFGHFAKFPSQGQTYPVFVYLGILPWTFFASSLGQVGSCVLSNRSLVQKVYFPRLILPISGLLVPAVDFLCSCTVLVGMMILFHVGVTVNVLMAPLFIVFLGIISFSVGAVFSAINVRYRDVPYAMGFIISIWMYLSPVVYATKSLPHKWEVLSSINPVSLGITGFRWAVGGTPPPTLLQIELGLPMAAVLLVFGFSFYRRWELRFADQL